MGVATCDATSATRDAAGALAMLEFQVAITVGVGTDTVGIGTITVGMGAITMGGGAITVGDGAGSAAGVVSTERIIGSA